MTEGPSSGLSDPSGLPGRCFFLFHRSFLSFLSTSFPGGLAENQRREKVIEVLKRNCLEGGGGRVSRSIPGACGSADPSMQTCLQPGVMPTLLPAMQHILDPSQWTLAEGQEQGPGGPTQLPGIALLLLTCEGSPGPQGRSRSSWDSRGGLWTVVIYLLGQKHC